MEEDVATTIDEVVITGTGAQRKLVQTGAITTVDMEHLMANPSSSVVNALAGNVAGVLARQTSGQPGQMFQNSGFAVFPHLGLEPVLIF